MSRAELIRAQNKSGIFSVHVSNAFADATAVYTRLRQNVNLVDFEIFRLRFPDFKYPDLYYYYQKVINRFPEFKFKYLNDGIGERMKYKGHYSICCSLISTHYYTTPNDSKIYFNNQDHNLDVRLYTCQPAALQPANNGHCDWNFQRVCFDNQPYKKYGINFDEIGKNTCLVWFKGFVSRVGSFNNSDNYSSIINLITKKCKNNIEECKEYLQVLSDVKDPSISGIKDKILQSQPRHIKNKYLQCSFPTSLILEKAKNIIEPRQCWDYNCIHAEDWQLLTSDLIVRDTTCTVSNCDIILNNVDIEQGDIKVSCRSANKTFENPILSYKNALDFFINNFKIISVTDYLIVIFCLLCMYEFIRNVLKIMSVRSMFVKLA